MPLSEADRDKLTDKVYQVFRPHWNTYGAAARYTYTLTRQEGKDERTCFAVASMAIIISAIEQGHLILREHDTNA